MPTAANNALRDVVNFNSRGEQISYREGYDKPRKGESADDAKKRASQTRKEARAEKELQLSSSSAALNMQKSSSSSSSAVLNMREPQTKSGKNGNWLARMTDVSKAVKPVQNDTEKDKLEKTIFG